MPIQIGQAEPGFENPVGLMTACHRRIENFLKTLSVAAELGASRPLELAELEALERALRYFREAAPHHTADEEEDLFPLMKGRDLQAADAIGRLEAEHVRAESLHLEVDVLGQRWLADGALSPTDLARFGDSVQELQGLYQGHIQTEEADVFPRAAQLLSRAELEAMGKSMAARRGR